MDNRLYRTLMMIAVALTVAWLGWSIYDSLWGGRQPGDSAYFAANTLFDDERYERALEEYESALADAPDHLHALRGKARSLLKLERYDEALAAFNEAIARDPEFPAAYANRGILHDQMGEYRKALADYEKALVLDPELAEGPHWMTRFLRLQPEKPPTIEARAGYLRQELEKPESERVLRVPEVDEAQRPYKM